LVLKNSRFLAGAAVLSFMIAVAGCQSDDAGGVFGVGQGNVGAQEGMVRESELRAYCPRVVLREGTATHRAFEKKAEDDPTKLIYQASITDVTRSCAYTTPGFINMTVAVAGKVVPGPKATTGSVTMPIRVAAIRGSEVVYSQLHNYAVTVDKATGAAQFIFSDPALQVPSITDGTLQVFVGFDEGPTKKTAAAD
jgi:hypothetical protein